MQLKVFKYEAAGNDFVALDGRNGAAMAEAERAALTRALCDRRRGVGADGLLVIESPKEAGTDFKMVYYNADGSRAEMCGNGARSIARFAVDVKAAKPQMVFGTDAGNYRAVVDGEGTTLSFPPVPGLPEARPLEAAGRKWDIDFLRVGVPHGVVWVNDLKTLDIETAGRAIRQHAAFAPAGTNVNFAQPDAKEEGLIRVRTYERGVEAETLACGTGSVATCMCFARRQGWTGKRELRVIPTGGDTLRIGFVLEKDGAKDVVLGGPAKLVFVTNMGWEGGRLKAEG